MCEQQYKIKTKIRNIRESAKMGNIRVFKKDGC